MTEIDVTRLGKWWNSMSRFFWSGLGVLCLAGGIIQLIREGNTLWGWSIIGAGITITIIPLTTLKCSSCGSPHSFEQVWKTVYNHHRFTCYACYTQHRLRLWERIFLNVVIYGYGFLTLASGCNQFLFNSLLNAPTYLVLAASFPLPLALTMLIVRFSFYERLDNA
jgi:hypothetical protein